MSSSDARQLGEEFSVEHRKAVIHGAIQAGEHGVGIGPVLAAVIDLEFGVRGEVGESGVDGVGHQHQVDDVIRIGQFHAAGHGINGHGKFFVAHPSGDFDDFVEVREDVAGIFDRGANAFEDRASDRLGPAKFVGASAQVRLRTIAGIAWVEAARLNVEMDFRKSRRRVMDSSGGNAPGDDSTAQTG